MSTKDDLANLVTAATDLLAEVRALQTGFEDRAFFGDATRLDDAIAKIEALEDRIVAAKTNFALPPALRFVRRPPRGLLREIGRAHV